MPAGEAPDEIDDARLSLRAVRRRGRQRLEAARQLALLAGHAGRPLVAGTIAVHLTAGLLPIVFLVAVSTAIQQMTGGTVGAHWDAALIALGVAAAAFIVHQGMAAAQAVLSQSVARRVDAYCITRFTRSAFAAASLRTLERPEIADRLSHADEVFEQWGLTPGAATEGALALTARYVQLLAALVLVGVAFGPWGVLAAAIAALVARRGQSAGFFRWGQVIRRLLTSERRIQYVRDLATGTVAAKEIRTLGLLDWLDRRYQRESNSYLDVMWRWRRRVYGRPFAVYAVIALAATFAALALAAAQAPTAGTSLGTVVLGVQAVVLCARFGVLFPESDVKMVFGRSGWAAVLEFEQACATAAETWPVAPPAVPGEPGPAAPNPRRRIAFEAVWFSYDERPVLRGLDLELTVGRSTALVGVNGAGKTTLVKLLTGLYTPSSGRVTVDGVDLRTLDPALWQRAFAVTFQDYNRYQLSLRDNVAMGAVAHREDGDGIIAELRRVGLADLLDDLPDGIDTPLIGSAQGGRELSGGQWQRLALARAMFAVRHGAGVLILDEPTAQLDARGEAEFYDTFLDLTRGVTSLVISHRFSSVRRADRIVVLDDGRVSEAGSHADLVAAGGAYATMFAIQARRFASTGGEQ